jgi:hypothetical protein
MKSSFWNIESMVKEDKAIGDEEMGFLKASKIFSAPKATLKYYVNSRDKKAEALVTIRMGRNSVLPVQIGNELVNYCLLMQINFSD